MTFSSNIFLIIKINLRGSDFPIALSVPTLQCFSYSFLSCADTTIYRDVLQAGSLKLSKSLFSSFFLKRNLTCDPSGDCNQSATQRAQGSPAAFSVSRAARALSCSCQPGGFAKKGTKCPGTGKQGSIFHCFAIRENKYLSYVDVGFVSSKGCREHDQVMFSSRWSKTSNHGYKYKFLQWKQKAKDIKVTAVFSALIILIENRCQLGIVQPFLGSSFNKEAILLWELVGLIF